MTKILTVSAWFLITTVVALGFLLFFEGLSLTPKFTPDRAEIVNVQNDSEWGFIGEEKRTLVQWTDGSRSYLPGALGEKGEVITAQKKDGTKSLF